MTEKHTLTAFEPVWQIQEFRKGDNIPEPIGNPVADSIVSAMQEHSEYEFSCGEEFDNWDQAVEHLQNRVKQSEYSNRCR